MATRAILLDFDGLVCDTERAAFLSWQEVYDSFGLEFEPAVWASMTGHATGERYAAAYLAGKLGRPVADEVIARRRDRKQALADLEPLRPGVRTLLDSAAERGIAAAVVSSSDSAWVLGHLARLGVRDHLAAVITGDQVPKRKPDPDGYLLALRTLGVVVSDALAFEDSSTGLRAALAAGLRCVAVPSSVAVDPDFTGADRVLDSLACFELDPVMAR
ncbi:putative hydrolase of the HAD superfamily [Amycolatopsis xylanica]|uniref:Putative hydrolase of the HAD superfamily n=1 Tax=Amycolatopsis xylanica TaxID=589385 RepID=A0A1H3EWM9_9PSEU|nr:HAD-IA family hydrolase [Amycolatopsis xylanica]SDX83136.1 putative hydrolase of the HAD superfamily [Amycolatopsis xylanica]